MRKVNHVCHHTIDQWSGDPGMFGASSATLRFHVTEVQTKIVIDLHGLCFWNLESDFVKQMA